jgi:hypothetical protein
MIYPAGAGLRGFKLWMRHENGNLRARLNVQTGSPVAKTTITMLKNQLNVAAEQSQRKELAQVAMRDAHAG